MTPNPKIQPKVKPQTEMEWEEETLSGVLKDAIDEDGNLDFDKLRSKGTNLTLEELYPNDDTDES